MMNSFKLRKVVTNNKCMDKGEGDSHLFSEVINVPYFSFIPLYTFPSSVMLEYI
jgi:hypothetical protein